MRHAWSRLQAKRERCCFAPEPGPSQILGLDEAVLGYLKLSLPCAPSAWRDQNTVAQQADLEFAFDIASFSFLISLHSTSIILTQNPTLKMSARPLPVLFRVFAGLG